MRIPQHVVDAIDVELAAHDSSQVMWDRRAVDYLRDKSGDACPARLGKRLLYPGVVVDDSFGPCLMCDRFLRDMADRVLEGMAERTVTDVMQ